MTKDYSETIKNAVEKFLKEDDWKYEFFDAAGVFRMGVSLNCRLQSTTMGIIIYDSSFMVMARSPIKTDTERMPAVAEFIARVNYGLRIGGFAMDFGDGDISYRASMYCGDEAPTQKQIAALVYSAVTMLNQYGDALAKVIYGFASPQQAIAEAEK